MKRRDFLKSSAAVAAGVAIGGVPWNAALGQSRKDTLLAISENGPNSLDIHGVGTNRPGYEASWNSYDRLVTFGVKKDAQGNDHYDYTKIEPELAEDWNATDTSVTFRLKRGAKFHDGTPVPAADVKWSYDRALTVGGLPPFPMKPRPPEEPRRGLTKRTGTRGSFVQRRRRRPVQRPPDGNAPRRSRHFAASSARCGAASPSPHCT